MYNMAASNEEKPIAVIIPSYNNEKNYRYNLDSVFAQKYTNYRVLYFDDASADTTYNCVVKYLEKHPQHKSRTSIFRSLINSKQSCHKFIASRLCRDDEIMIFLDGDDWLKNDSVFQVLNQAYHSGNIWVTYGSFERYENKMQNRIGSSRPIPSNIVKNNSYRKYAFCTSHLRTCYAWLYKLIPIEYLTDPGLIFLSFATDVAEMRCLIEMSGNRHMFISKILYVYNMVNSALYANSHENRKKIKSKYSDFIINHVAKMTPFQPLAKPIKHGITLTTPLDLSGKIITNPVDMTNLNPAFFYYKSGNKIMTDSDLELAIRYMINIGIDLFIVGPLVIAPKKYNIVTPNSYYEPIKIITVLLDKILTDDLKGGYICTTSGYQKIAGQKIEGQNKDKLILTYFIC